MVVHHFPGSAETLGHRIREASIDSRVWQGVVRAVAERFPGTECEIVFLLHGGRTIAVRLAGTRDRLAMVDAGNGSSSARLALMTEPAEVDWLQPGLLPTGHEEGAALTLKRLHVGEWRLRLRSAGAPGHRVHEAMAALLGRLRPILVPAFTLAVELEAGRMPARERLETVLDPLPHAAMLLTPAMRPHFVNVAGEHTLAVRSLFRPMGRGGSLRAASNRVQDDLERQMGAILAGSTDRARLDVQMPGDGRPFQLRLVRVGGGALDWPNRSQVREGAEHVILTVRPAEDAKSRSGHKPVALPLPLLRDVGAGR